MSWGKPRTKLGEWMYRRKITGEWLRKETGLNKNTITSLTTDKFYNPLTETKAKIIKALRKVDPTVSASDFW